MFRISLFPFYLEVARLQRLATVVVGSADRLQEDALEPHIDRDEGLCAAVHRGWDALQILPDRLNDDQAVIGTLALRGLLGFGLASRALNPSA